MTTSQDLPAGYLLRNWAAADLEELTALDELVFGPDAWSRELIDAEYKASTGTQPRTYYRVIEYQHALVGFAGLLFGAPYADLTTIGIHPDHTGQGLGNILLQWAIEQARTLDAQDLLLEVRADNASAQRLYARNGFTHIHTRPRYYPGSVDAWIMRKPLRDPAR